MNIDAHTITRDSGEFADGIFFDGRTPVDPDAALYLQAAVDDQDGIEIYAEIPIQKFATDAGILKAIIEKNTIFIILNEPLNGYWEYRIALPVNNMDDALASLRHIFRRQPESLIIQRNPYT